MNGTPPEMKDIAPDVLPYITSAWTMIDDVIQSGNEVRMMAVMANRSTAAMTIFPAAGVPSKELFAKLLLMFVQAHCGEMPKDAPPAIRPVLAQLMNDLTKGDPIYPDLVVHMSEAWMLNLDTKMPPEEMQAAIDRANKEGLRNHPNRMEVAIVGWKTKDGDTGHLLRKIVRDEKGARLGDYMYNKDVVGWQSMYLDSIFADMKKAN